MWASNASDIRKYKKLTRESKPETRQNAGQHMPALPDKLP
jgi:hypothetical protein